MTPPPFLNNLASPARPRPRQTGAYVKHEAKLLLGGTVAHHVEAGHQLLKADIARRVRVKGVEQLAQTGNLF